MATLKTTVSAMANGVAGVTGVGKTYRVELTTDGGGSWVVGDTITLTFLHTLTGFIEEVGFGNVSGQQPTFCLTFKDKVYVLAGSLTFFSELSDPTSWNNPEGVGNGFVNLVNYYSSPEALQAIATYQGRLAFFSRTTTQIWNVEQDPAAWSLVQTLPNIGTVAPRSVQSLGDLEVFFVADSGIRSLRARETVLNAIVTDIGSPVEPLVQPLLQAMTDTEKLGICGVVEPSANRLWEYIDGVIWVLSYFPSNKITAWSKYLPTYELAGVQTTFVPTQFTTHKGQVYARAGDALYLYGGSDNNTYDNARCDFELPWLDYKTPGTFKQTNGLDVGFQGAWQFEASCDPQSGIASVVYTGNNPTFLTGKKPWSMRGTHFKIKGHTTGSTYARVSTTIAHYELCEAQ